MSPSWANGVTTSESAVPLNCLVKENDFARRVRPTLKCRMPLTIRDVSPNAAVLNAANLTKAGKSHIAKVKRKMYFWVAEREHLNHERAVANNFSHSR